MPTDLCVFLFHPKANRAHTYLGKPESEWHQSHDEADIYPDFPAMAKSFGVPSRRVIRKADIRGAIREMLDTPGPYLLEVRTSINKVNLVVRFGIDAPALLQVMVPHIEHVLPMIPGGASFKDIITEGDGSVKY